MANWSLSQLQPVAYRWYEAAEKFLGPNSLDADADDNWFDFAEGWDKVKYPGEGGLMAMLLERAKQSDLPRVAMRYRSDRIRLLIALCRELQEAVDRIDHEVWGDAVTEAYEDVGDQAERVIQKRLRQGR